LGAAATSAPRGSCGASSKSTANEAAAFATTAAYEGALRYGLGEMTTTGRWERQ
jgi:hypothetical protein